MRCIIVDDEPLAREGLEAYVARIPFLELVGSFDDALPVAEAVRDRQVDLMFLDIQMPHLTGIEFLKSLSAPPMVIFHTAYPNFALEGYQLDVMDYLVKPVTFERFYRAATKAHEYYRLKRATDPKPGTPDYLFIRCERRYEKVMLGEILYVEAVQNYSIIQTTTQKLVTPMNLKALEELLPPHAFERVHKSYIIALDKVEAFVGPEIRVGAKLIQLSDQQRNSLFARLAKPK